MKKTILLIAILMIMSMAVPQAQEPMQLPPGDSPPPTAFNRIKNAGNAADFDSADYVIVIDSSVNTINEKGVSNNESYILYKILTEEGCKNKPVLNWGYEPLSSFVEIREVNIIRGDQAIPVAKERILDLPAPQSGIYWSNRIKVLQLPRLQVGDGIEIKSFRKGYSYALLDSKIGEPDDDKYIPPMPGQYFDIVLFESAVPIIEKKYVLKMPADKRIHSRIYNGPMFSSTSYVGDTTFYAWWIKDAPAWESQIYDPDPPDILTKVVIATVESWEAKSRWFFDVNEPQFAYTDAIKAKVDEIFAQAGVTNGTEEQKAFELVHWVAQNIRYSGQTMGKGEGYTLHPGAMIFEQRSGVCKDIAGMLITMMRAAGMDSYGAMTMAGSRIEEVPADQFNHCVVALRKDDGRFVMYDPTWVPDYNDIWSKYEAEQHYLIGSPQGNGLSKIPYSPPEESELKVTNTGKILNDGSLEAVLELKGSGVMDSRLRGFITYQHLDEIDNYLARILHYAGNGAIITKYEHGEVMDFHEDMWWRIEYRIPNFALFIDDGYEFVSPMMQMTCNSLYRSITFDWPEEQQHDIFFYASSFLNGTETLKLPGGYKITEPVKGDEIDETYAYSNGSSKMSKGQLQIEQQVKIKRRQIPPDDYAGFREAIQSAKEYGKTTYRAEKGDTK